MSHDIESPGNERIRRLARLRRRGSRDAERVFVVEEERVLARAISSGYQPTELYWCPELASMVEGTKVAPVSISFDAANRASYRGKSTGLIALFSYLETELSDFVIPPEPLYLVVEGLEKPGNLGAVMRIADGAGADGVIVVDPAVDPFNPNVVRSSTGALFTVRLAVCEDVAQVREWLEAANVMSTAADPEGDSTIWASDLTGRRAIWIGSEANGLTPAALRVAESRVAIPMAGRVDSLNSSVAAALLVYESVRQRSART